jgi:hypothetical protein
MSRSRVATFLNASLLAPARHYSVPRHRSLGNHLRRLIQNGKALAESGTTPVRMATRGHHLPRRMSCVTASSVATDLARQHMLAVNVALRRWRFMYDMGITAASYRDQFGFSCNLRQSMVVGDYRPPLHPDRPTILTFYVPFERPGSSLKEQAVAARTELLATSYRGLRAQDSRTDGASIRVGWFRSAR